MSLTGADGEGVAPREGALVLCLDADAFRPATELRASVDALRARLRDSSRPGAPVLAPGDPEAQARASAAGVVAVDGRVVAQLRALALHAARPTDAPGP